MKFSIQIFLILIVSMNVYGQKKEFQQIMLEHQIDLGSKSIKSWLRLFNSSEKLKEEGYSLDEIERFTVLRALKKIQKNSNKKYNRRIK